MNSICEDTFVMYMTLMTAVTFEIVVAFMTKNIYFLIMACNSAIVPNWYFSQNTHLFKKEIEQQKRINCTQALLIFGKTILQKVRYLNFNISQDRLKWMLHSFFKHSSLRNGSSTWINGGQTWTTYQVKPLLSGMSYIAQLFGR